MTGEITLRGECCRSAALKEKLLRGRRGGIKTVLIPEENVKDLAEIPDEIKNRLDIRPVRWIEHVLRRRSSGNRVPLAVHAAGCRPPVPPREPHRREGRALSSTDAGCARTCAESTIL
jgi:ATP-dependent Lon protease